MTVEAKKPDGTIVDEKPDKKEQSKKRTGKKGKKKIIIPIVALLLVGAIVTVLLTRNGGSSAAVDLKYTSHTVGRSDLTSSMSGSGTLQPADSYTVTGLVSGEILEAPFEEGDYIEKGAVLYRIDPKTAEQNIKTARENVETAQESLERAQKSYQDLLSDKAEHNQDRADERANLRLNSKVSGQVTKVYVEAGDTVQAGTVIADVLDSSDMLLTVPFLADDASGITVGSSASVTLPSGETIQGKVDSVSSVSKISSKGVPVRDVVIAVANPGGLYEGMSATAEVGGSACYDSGSFEYNTNSSIKATKAGEIESLYIKEGDNISEGGRVLNIKESDDTVDYDKQIDSALDTIKDAERTLQNRLDSLETAEEALDDYVITSPISGTVVEKTFKEGDTVNSTGNASNGMAVIYDLSSLNFVMNVDELDISLIEIGQKATITADAVDGIYTGTVTRTSVKGTTSGGVTSYPVTVEIDKTDALLPGMNVSVEIIVSQSENAIVVPTGAVQRGNRVLVQTKEGADPNAAVPEGSMLPDGFEYKEVVLGETDGTFIEVLEGLQEGDVIAYIVVANTGQDGMTFIPGMGGMTVTQVGPGEVVYSDSMPAGGGNFQGGGGGGFQGGGRP